MFDKRNFGQSKDYFAKLKKKVPFCRARGNVELILKCSTEHLCLVTARIKYDKETQEESKKRTENIWQEIQRSPKKSRRPTVPPGSLPLNQWMNYLTNLTYTNNPSTTQKGMGVKWYPGFQTNLVSNLLQYYYSQKKGNYRTYLGLYTYVHSLPPGGWMIWTLPH